MAYVEVQKQGGKEYFYLTKNVRLSLHRWKKVRVFLGDKKPSKEELINRLKAIEEKSAGIVTASSYSFLSERDAETLQDIKAGYAAWIQQTPLSVRERTNEDFVIRFTYNSNAIEGNRLTLRQTALILKDKVIPSGVRAQDYNEAINGKECMDYVRTYAGGMNTRFVERINALLTKNTDVVYGGRLRFFDVQIAGSKHVPPGHADVKRHMQNLQKWYSANKGTLHPFELAVMIHAKLAWIHPFEDGNGRTARTVMNYILLRKGFPMFFMPFEKREAYYRALEKADQGDHKGYVADMLALVIAQIRSYGRKDRHKSSHAD
jgi:Fic family protein